MVDELPRRLSWLLVFRATIATGLLLLTLVVDFFDLPLAIIASLLYGVVVGSFVLVLLLGVLLRSGASCHILAAVHLAAAVFSALMVVEGTGGIDSAFSFLYLLAILDAAIIGGGRIALVVATACALAYGAHLTLQLYGVLPLRGDTLPPPSAFTGAVVVHFVAFYLTALLGGHLAALVQRAQDVATVAVSDLRQAEKLHEAVLGSLPVAVLTFDGGGTVRMVNAAAEVLLKAPERDLVGHPVPEPLASCLRCRTTAAEHRVALHGAERVLGMQRSSVGRPAADTEGADTEGARSQESGLEVLVLEDRTKVRALEADLRTKDRLAGIGQLSASLAHELRNPLAAISGCVEMMQSESGDEDEARRLRAIVLRESDRLNKLLTEFLSYARPAPPDRMDLDVAALTQEVCDALQCDPTAASHRVAVALPEGLRAHADPGQLRQVLWNLLKNAVEASPLDAPVHVRGRLEQGDRGAVSVIEITDQGPGLSRDVEGRLFEPFCTTKEAGTGLGLAIVHRIVTAHDGCIDLISEAPRGTTARLTLPVVAPRV